MQRTLFDSFLSPRQIEVLRYASEGLTAKETGDILGVNQNTVRTHLSFVMDKLGAKNTPHAVAIAVRTGVI